MAIVERHSVLIFFFFFFSHCSRSVQFILQADFKLHTCARSLSSVLKPTNNAHFFFLAGSAIAAVPMSLYTFLRVGN